MRATSSLSACGCMWVSASVTTTSSWRACAEADVEPVGLAAVDRVADHPAARVAGRRLERRGLGGVGGAVVEDEHLELG